MLLVVSRTSTVETWPSAGGSTSSNFRSGSRPRYQDKSGSQTRVGYGLFVINPGTGDFLPRGTPDEYIILSKIFVAFK